jgi:serine/threonine protein kinase/tetratricopeptide (TPR) repeat protein
LSRENRSPFEGTSVHSLAASLAEEMAREWDLGQRQRAEDLLKRHPEILNDSEAAIKVIYEEVRLRQDAGEEVRSEELAGRFPEWQGHLGILLECDRLVDQQAETAVFPAIGETLGEFQLVAELGRGALGRVFLAKQPALADRPVVLKVTPRGGLEYLSLARLQHTHIVPLYNVQDFLAQDLRVLCMPYLGGASLAQLLTMLQHRPPDRRTGADLIAALDRAQESLPVSIPATGPARQFLTNASYVEAVCWIGTCIADALHFAHQRGLVHLDLKPSNILLTADGEPMLLDFHLAREPLSAGAAPPAWFGGTPGYMSPEQLTAGAAVRWRRPIPRAVDGRSDVYSLGLLLLEALGGAVATGQAPPIAKLRSVNPQVTVGMADILSKCIALNPSDRYQNAAMLAGDLRRHLAHLPLAGVSNRSLIERWQKWRHRSPMKLALVGIILAIVATVATAAGLALTHIRQRLDQAELALVNGRNHFKNRDYRQAICVLAQGGTLARDTLGGSELARELEKQARLARRARAAEDLRAVADRIRFYFEPESLTPHQARTLEASCKDTWDARTLLVEESEARLEPEVEQRIPVDLLDLGILWADLHVRSASPKEAALARRDAEQVLEEAQELFGKNPVLYRERLNYVDHLGAKVPREKGNTLTAELAPRSAWEHYALGRSLLRSGKLQLAAAELEEAIAIEPGGFWSRFYYGICAHRLRNHHEAVTSFSVCIALSPESATSYFNRALAQEALGRADSAMGDYTFALRHDPSLGRAALNRGVLHFRERRYSQALADFQSALAGDADPATVYYNMALVCQAQRDRRLAVDFVRRALEHNPKHAGATELERRLKLAS